MAAGLAIVPALVLQEAQTLKTTRQRLLELMAARIGATQLAVLLGVPCAILKDWLSGQAVMPDPKLVTLINLIDETASE